LLTGHSYNPKPGGEKRGSFLCKTTEDFEKKIIFESSVRYKEEEINQGQGKGFQRGKKLGELLRGGRGEASQNKKCPMSSGGKTFHTKKKKKRGVT